MLGYVPEKVTAWESYYIFVEEPADRPFNFLPWDEGLPLQVDSSTLTLDSQTTKLNEIFFEDSFNLEQMCSHEPLLAFWVIHHDPLLARDLDLGELLFFYFKSFVLLRMIILIEFFSSATDIVMTGFLRFNQEDAARRQTPLPTASSAVEPVNAIANRKIAEIHIGMILFCFLNLFVQSIFAFSVHPSE